MTKIFYGTVENGKLKLYSNKEFSDCLLFLNGKEIKLSVSLATKTRSLPQNKYLWAVPYQLISDATGYTREEVHDAMRMLFLLDNSKDMPVMRSTTSLSTTEMNEYFAKIQQFAAEKLNLVIPDPNECGIQP